MFVIKKKLLVVVDYQNDFVNGSLGFDGAEKLDDRICEKLHAYYKNGDDVVLTLDTHEQMYLMTVEGRHLPVKHCIRGTAGHNLYGRVGKLAADSTVLYKNTFGCAALGDYLRDKDYSSIELVGLVSNMCVAANAIICKTFSPDSEIIIDAACTDSPDKETQKKCFDVLRAMHIEVKNID